MTGNNAVSAQLGHGKPIKLGVDADGRHNGWTDKFFQEVMNGLSDGFWNVEEYKVRWRRLHCPRRPCLLSRDPGYWIILLRPQALSVSRVPARRVFRCFRGSAAVRSPCQVR